MVHKELSPKQKIIELLKTSQKIAVVIAGASIEHDYAAIGFAHLLMSSGRSVDVLSLGGHYPEIIKQGIFSGMPPLRSFDHTPGYRIVVRPKTARLTSLKYDHVPGGGIDIAVEADGDVASSDIDVILVGSQYDVVLCLGADAYELARSHFQDRVVLVYISAQDKRIMNEELVQFSDNAASCVGEMLVAFSESIYKDGMGADVVTGYYASMMVATDRLQNRLTSPKALTVAAQLLALGARREEVLSNLFGYSAPIVAPIKSSETILSGFAGDSKVQQDKEPAGLSEDELYAPQEKDVVLSQPQIIDESGARLLQRLMAEKKQAKDVVDFAALEEEVHRKGVDLGDDFDEIG